jgi:mannosyltransferase
LSDIRRIASRWLPLAVALAAFAVRIHNLAYHSLWFDEAMSVHWARSDVGRILEVSMNLVEDRLPPLYYLLLHGWRILVGDGEVAMRLPSALMGVLLVPVVYRLATDLFDRRVAFLSAALVALNPFLVWYGQEARMYALAALLGTLGTWCFVRAAGLSAARRASAAWWIGYGLCVLAGLYTHPYTVFLVPAQAVYLLVARWWTRRVWLPFVLTLLVVAGLFAPLALAIMRASTEAGPGNPLSGLGERLWALLVAFTVWKAPLPAGLGISIGALMGLLALVGLCAGVTSHATTGVVALQAQADGVRSLETSHSLLPTSYSLLPLLLLTPLAIATVLMLHNRLAFFGERYFIVVVPWLLMAVALGAVRLADLARRLPRTPGYPVAALCYLMPILLTMVPLPGQWSPAARKEAWRETVGYLATHAHNEDAILIHPDWTRYPLQYYFRGPGQTYAVFSSVDKHTDLDSPLAAISRQHPVVWLVESHSELADPQHRVNAWLAARYPLVTELYPPGLVAVRAYAPGYLTDRLPDFATPTSFAFQGGPRLLGYWVPDGHISATDDVFHPPSGWVHVASYWGTEAALGQNFTPFAHVVDQIGQVWGASLERASDAFHLYPTSRWQPGQVVRADFDVNLNPITPPGAYMLVIGLRDAAGVQVPLSDDSSQAVLARVEITR